MGFENFDKISVSDQEDITKHDIKRQTFHPDKESRDSIKADRGPKGYREITDDMENEDLVNANDPEKKYVPINEVEGPDLMQVAEENLEDLDAEEVLEKKRQPVEVKEVDEFVMDDNEGKIATAHFEEGDQANQLLISREAVPEGVGPLRTDVIEELNEAKVDKYEGLPKADSSGKLKSETYGKSEGGHYKGGHYPSGQEKSDTKFMQRTRRDGKEDYSSVNE